MPRWDPQNPLVVRDALTALPALRPRDGLVGDLVELHQNLYACLRVGRLDRAAIIIDRLATVYNKDAPELIDAHNAYLQTLLDLGQLDPGVESMKKIETWCNDHMLAKDVPPNAQTFVTLIRSAMNFLEEGDDEAAVREYIATAREYGEDILDQINASPEFSDEEWDLLIRLQPESFQEPPPVDQVQHLHVSTPLGRKNLIEHGLVSHPSQPIKPVKQKGMGLDSLKQALTIFDHEARVPYPHDMPGTQEEKDQAYAYARQLQMEQDGIEAAVKRWKAEDEKLQEVGVYGVMNSKPIQAIMYGWYSALVPLFKKRIEQAKEVLSDSTKSTARDEVAAYGVWLERCKPEKLAAITVARATQAAVKGKDEDNSAYKISALSIAVGNDIEEYLDADSRARRDAFLRKQRISSTMASMFNMTYKYGLEERETAEVTHETVNLVIGDC